jgi:outer membrane lipoprotein LolB
VIRAWALLVLLLMTGCATQPRSPPTPTIDPSASAWASRRAHLEPRQHWVFDGRLAVQNGNEGGQAKIHWVQTGPAFDLKIMAPLGQGTYQLHGDARGVVMTTPKNGQFTAPDLATLMNTHLHWNLPVAGARYWMLGLPAPGSDPDNLRLDEQGLLTDMAQDGWRISVLDYQTVGDTVLPRKLFLTANDLKLRLAITQWSTPPH